MDENEVTKAFVLAVAVNSPDHSANDRRIEFVDFEIECMWGRRYRRRGQRMRGAFNFNASSVCTMRSGVEE